MNRKVLIVGGVLIVPLLVFLGWGFKFDPRKIDSPLIGKPAPPFSLVDLDGKTVKLEALRGRPVVLNFWATWCQPCILEHPVFEAGARRFGDQVAFLGVVYQDDPLRIRSFQAQNGSWGLTLVDPGSSVAIAYGVYGVPETYLIDAEGVIVEKYAYPLMDARPFFARLEGLIR